MKEGRRYRIEGVLGKGGFGTVYKAELVGEAGFSKAVAMKVLNPDVAAVDEVAQRLRDEARILGLVRHRAIVKVDGLVQVEGRWAVVMEYVEGVDLKRLLKRGPVPLGPALEIGAEVASALRVALDQPGKSGTPLGLLHRDIKPSNLQLTAAGEVKILDFGTARAQFGAREAKTRSLAFGTLDYMAPERLDFQDLPAGDVYALGSVLYELLTGEKVGRTSPREDKHAEVLALAQGCLAERRIPIEVAELLAHMLAWAPERRPTVHEVERRLRRLRGGLDEPWLAEWAGRVVPPVLATHPELESGELSGTVVLETSGARMIPNGEAPESAGHTEFVQLSVPEPPPAPETGRPPAPDQPTGGARPTHAPAWSPPPSGDQGPDPTPRRRSPALIIALLAVLAVVASGVLAVALLLGGDDEPDVAAATVQPDAASDQGTTTLAAGTDQPSEKDTAASTEGASTEGASTEGAPTEVAPAPEPKPTTSRPRTTATTRASSNGRLVVGGDAQSVTLVGDKGRYGPGSVPAGRYRIEATFEGRGKVLAGEVTIAAGQTVRINCNRAFARCQVGG